MTRRSVVVHGHYYQPPREDPWLEEVPVEASAAPFHDWNDRIEHECYRAVVAARVPTPDGKIARITNTLAATSFNVGPTLLEWLEREAPATYAAILEADRTSVTALDGHGNAMAAPYHHTILPLATRRDKETEVRWGIADFRRRFGREPEGMWLPETAVDDETLDVLAQEGIRFTVLAPHQLDPVPHGGLPAVYETHAGRTITLFAYDGSLSHDVAFGPLVRDAAAWARRIVADRSAHLTAVATDGETYGHHHRFGEMALAALLATLEGRSDVRVENFASFLARHPPTHAAHVVERTSWSCSHGVERWRAACGCRMHPERATQQAWRAVLREALEWLAESLHARFLAEGAALFPSPWAARDAYGAVVGLGPDATPEFVRRAAKVEDAEGRRRAAELLEMERNALRMFTSCGWFFDDIGGLETRQVLAYAARALALAGSDAAPLEGALRERLARARSNDPSVGTGRDVYDATYPRLPVPALVAAAHAVAQRIDLPPASVLPRALRVGTANDQVEVASVRTGRVSRWGVTVTHQAGAAPVATVTADGHPPMVVPIRDLPDVARVPIARVLRRRIVTERFRREHLEALAAGDALLDVAERALVASVEALDGTQDADACLRVLDLLTLFDLFEHPFPFDAQTAFYRLWTAHDPHRDHALARIASRLGFA